MFQTLCTLILLLVMITGGAFGQLLPSGGAATNLTQIGGTNVVTGGVNGSLGVGGLAAVGAATAGNPVKIGGVHRTTPATLTDGQQGEHQLDTAQNLLVRVNVALPAGTNNIGDVDILSFPDNEPFNVAQINGVTPLMGNGATGTGSQRVTIASDNTSFNTYSIRKTACGATVFSQAWVAVPTSEGTPTSTTTCVEALSFTNTNATGQTVTVTDGQGSPITLVATYSIPGNSTAVFPFHGAAATTGLKWVAGGTGVTGAILGYQ